MVLNKFDDFKWWLRMFLKHTKPFSWIRDLSYEFKYRFIKHHKYNLVDTGLKPGYYEVDHRMFHACFNLLVDFIEFEQAWMSLNCSDDELKKVPWWMSKNKYCLKHGRELGFKHLDWGMALTMELNDNGYPNAGSDLQINHVGTQGWACKEMKELYTWYKEVYSNRWKNEKYCYELDDFYEKEQTQMLVRLIKIRGYLWT